MGKSSLARKTIDEVYQREYLHGKEDAEKEFSKLLYALCKQNNGRIIIYDSQLIAVPKDGKINRIYDWNLQGTVFSID